MEMAGHAAVQVPVASSLLGVYIPATSVVCAGTTRHERSRSRFPRQTAARPPPRVSLVARQGFDFLLSRSVRKLLARREGGFQCSESRLPPPMADIAASRMIWREGADGLPDPASIVPFPSISIWGTGTVPLDRPTPAKSACSRPPAPAQAWAEAACAAGGGQAARFRDVVAALDNVKATEEGHPIGDQQRRRCIFCGSRAIIARP